jgi:hypothetical protein
MQIEEESPRLRMLRMLLALDATLLFLLGALLIVWPSGIERAFHFENMPGAVSYIIGLWGCVYVSLAAGYFIAALDPVRHVTWVQIGIARGALECVFGLIALARNLVTWNQAGAGIAVAAMIAIAYVVLYPWSKS